MTSNNKLSTLVSSQVPFFVRNDHPGIVTFLEKYYEFLEQNGQTVDAIKNLTNYADIDRTTDALAEKFYTHFISHIPNWAIADKRLIVKHVKEFYLSRGTERSIQFLINILFGQPTSFYYPKQDILKASDGRWFIEKSLKIRDVKINGQVNTDINILNYIINKTISGNTSNATAIIETIDVYYEKLDLIKEIKLSGQTKDFSSGEEIFTTFTRDGQEYSFAANVYSGFINTLTLTNTGAGYSAGTVVPVESNTGNGAIITIDAVSRGNIKSLSLVYGGAGFRVGDPISITGGDGVGANAYVLAVDTSNTIHQSAYNIVSTMISSYAGNTINTFANNTFSNVGFSFEIYNLGPIIDIKIVEGGENYLTIPTIDVIANTNIRQMNILGRMEIENSGLEYRVGDIIQFTNRPGGYGSGANAIVSAVDLSSGNSITKVDFVPNPGQIIGGSGYNVLPTANVISATGNGAVIVVTAVLGDGEIITPTTDTIGKIESIKIVDGGSGYLTEPKVRLDLYGDGLATVTPTVITGIYTYPGRFINDQGLLSSHMSLQDGTYYHNYSYVVRTPVPLNKYRKPLSDLIHPSGLKFFADYIFEDRDGTINVTASAATTPNESNLSSDIVDVVLPFDMYPNTNPSIQNSQLMISYINHPYVNNDNVRLTFVDTSINNYSLNVSSTTANSFNITYPERKTANSSSNGNVRVAISGGFYKNKTFVSTANVDINVITSDMSITFANHGFSVNDTISLKFDTSSILNTIVTISSSQQNTFNVLYPSRVTSSGNLSVGYLL